MEQLVIAGKTGKDVTTSLIVAQVFGKEHNKVCRDIENLSCSTSFNAANFGVINYTDVRGRSQTAYELTKDGFSFLVMGYTGEKASEFKEKFITEFNKREAMLKSDDYILARSQEILQTRLQAATQQLQIAQGTIEHQQKRISILEPKAEFMDRVMGADQKIDIGQAAKILGLQFGRNTLFVKLREKGVFFKNRNEPKQEYIERGYFELKEKWIDREHHEGFMVVKVLVTQRGLDFIAKLFEVVTAKKNMAKMV